jgi:histidinol-phosphate aminotransferase
MKAGEKEASMSSQHSSIVDCVRPSIRGMAGYVPGEQPRGGAFIKLNTNENPYPPSPRVLEALHAALTGDRLRKYPDPAGTAFRQTAGRVLDVDPDAILIGNGSDDILTILTRTFVAEGGKVAGLMPSYLLYETLARIQGAELVTVPFAAGWNLPQPWPLPGADLTFLPNPNSPSGTTLSIGQLGELAASLRKPIVIDEAYADFAEENALGLLRKQKNVVITRTLSKSYSLAGIRFGFAVADPALVREFLKVKDSYNCDVLSLAAAEAALEDQEYFRTTRAKILATRARLAAGLGERGFTVTPSHANFVWCRRDDRTLKPIYEELKRRMILVRYMDYPGYGDGLRITVGTDAEIDKLLEELRTIVGNA